MKDALLAGLDIGSTTVKLVAVDSGSGETVWKSYERHRARPADVAHHALVALAGRNNGRPIHLCATGSGAAPTADLLGVDHIQEVWAVSLAVQARNPEARTVVELGGEDAKAIVMGDGLPTGRGLRTVSMNDRCAGGTGVVIDHVAGRLGMDPRSLSCEDYAAGHIHPVSAKCGVFAESDVVSLHRQGVPDTDLMASLFSAIVRQNLAVLARGHALHPPVVLLGGPHRHLPGLAEAWRRALPALWTDRGVQVPDTSRTALVAVPEDAEFYAAFGAVEHLRGRTEPGEENAGLDLDRYSAISRHSGTESRRGIPGLGSDPDDLAAFRHAYPPVVPALSVVEDGDPVIIGIDAGSTSVKAVALDVHGDVVAKAYRLNQADPIDDAQAVLADLRSRLETSISRPRVAGLAVTGYAKDLFAQVFGADRVLVETAAHAAGGLRVQPDADVICDLGGQDIKVMLVDDGAVHDFRLNSQCCAGTGHFLQASAESLGIVPEDYADHAFRAAAMPEFQHGCAVFLQSERVAFQRDGWGPAEILAGLAAVLPKNVWLHVCRTPDLPRLGRTFVLQGGTQRNLAAVKAQVDYIQRQFKRTGIFPQIIVHPHCGEAGAVGCALELLDGMDAPWRASSFIGFDAAATLRHQSRRDDSVRCTGCGNACVRTFIELITPDGPVRRIMAGACESGEDGRGLLSAVSSAETPASNLSRRAARDAFKPVALPQVVSRPARRFASKRVAATREGLRIGMPQILDFYGLAPFFSGFFQHLGVPGENLIWSGFTAPRLIEDGLGLGRIDPCFPSKVAAAHVHALLKRHRSGRDPLTHLFMPMIDSMPTWLTGVMASKACPAAVGTPEAVYGALMHSG
ncbi:MAG: CoA activase, partial [bacterium]|nr:CoA activase [bacterium]